MAVSPDQTAARVFPLGEQLMDRIRAGNLELPLLPGVSTRVLSMALDETGCEAHELAELIQRDPAMAGNVLGVSNSAAFAPKEPVVSLQQAVSRLGFRTVCDVAVSVAMRGKVFRVPGQEERIRALWQHSATAGVWAKEIARRLRTTVEGAFLCGLMHDVGKPVLLQGLLDLAREGGTRPDTDDVEQCLATYHEEVGGLLVRHWGLPGWMAATIGAHHSNNASGADDSLVAAVRLADVLAHWTNQADAAERRPPRDAALLEQLGLYPEDLDELMAGREDVILKSECFL